MARTPDPVPLVEVLRDFQMEDEEPPARRPGRPRREGDRITTAVRLPRDLHERLAEAAEDRDVSRNRLVTKALTAYLDRLDADPDGTMT